MRIIRAWRERRWLLGAATVALLLAVGGIVAATAFSAGSAVPAAKLDTTVKPVDDRPAYDWNAPPLADGVVVPDVAAARAHLPFAPSVPGNAAAPSRVYVSDPSRSPRSEQAFAAVVRDPKYGLFQVLEQQTAMTEDQLEAWAQDCNTCTVQQVATFGQRHFLILASPGHGLAISWLTGTTLHTIIGPEETLTEANALALAAATND
jgi:hypothetical protein